MIKKGILQTESGFAFVDLAMLIIIFLILGGVMIPISKDLVMSAKKNSEEKVMAEVRDGLAAFFADPSRGNHKAFPAVLDTALNGRCTPQNPCFTLVLSRGGVTAEWVRESESLYRGPAGTRCHYQPALGKFSPAE